MNPQVDKLVRGTTIVATITASYFLLTADYGPEPNVLDPVSLTSQIKTVDIFQKSKRRCYVYKDPVIRPLWIKCPDYDRAETIVRSKMAWIYSQQRNVSAQLMRLFFHDCFIEIKKAMQSIESSVKDFIFGSKTQPPESEVKKLGLNSAKEHP